MSSLREQLLGYLLDTLEPQERESVAQALKQHPDLQRDLQKMQICLQPLGFPERELETEIDGPPPGLAARTCYMVAETADSLTNVFTTPIKPSADKLSPASVTELQNTSQRMSWADIVVAASVLLAASALLFPAIASSRHQAQINTCQNNLREVGTSLQQFANLSVNRTIPAVPLQGNRGVAGIYSVLLKQSGLLSSEHMLACPSSEFAKQHADIPFRIPLPEEIDNAVGETLAFLQKNIGGSYGYNMGFMDSGKLQAPVNEGRSHYVVMSDAPSSLHAARKSFNHGGRGQNMLYEDNHIRYVVDFTHDFSDDPYRNRSGIVAAGEDRNDIVLGESNARPMPALFFPLRD
jgi:hypothetical protein